MDTEFIEKMAPRAGKKQRITLRQLNFQKRHRRPHLEEEMRDLENEFRSIDKEKYPVEWHVTQKELGEKYKELMGLGNNL